MTNSDTLSRFQMAYVKFAKYDANNALIKHPYLCDIKKTKKQIEEANIVCMHGTWTNAEMQILYEGISNYKRKYNVDNFGDHFRNVLSSKRKVAGISLEVGRNINRRLRSINGKLYIMHACKDNKKDKPLSQEEKDQILSLQKIHGNKWKLISEIIGRNLSTVSTFYNNRYSPYHQKSVTITSSKRKRRFSSAEDQILLKLVLKQGLERNGKINESKINWLAIAEEIGTRTASDVMKRWQFRLSTNFNNDIVKTFYFDPSGKDRRSRQLEINVKILKILIKKKIEDKNDINWKCISQCIGDNYDPRILKVRFDSFLVRHTNSLIQKTYYENLNEIYEKRKVK